MPAVESGDPDAALFAAAEALARSTEEHATLWQRAHDHGRDPFADPAVADATRRLRDSGFRFARTPAHSIHGIALKLRHIVLDVTEGRTRWAADLARGALADAERMVAKR